MINTVTNHKNKSEALIKTVQTALGELKKTNKGINSQIEINDSAIKQHHMDVQQLESDNKALALLHADNETFISKVEEILGE